MKKPNPIALDSEEAWRRLGKKKGFAGMLDMLLPMAEPAILLHAEEKKEPKIPLGASKLGGCPDLPKGMPFPICEANGLPMAFLAQIDLKQMHPFDTKGCLPDQGMLWFFADCSDSMPPWGFEREHRERFCVLYREAPGDLIRIPFPEDLDEEYSRFTHPMTLTPERALLLPDPISSHQTEGMAFDPDEMDAFIETVLEPIESYPHDHLLGHADTIQNPMEPECAEITADWLGPGEANADDWILLLQIDSHDEQGMMWGDCGRLYFWIRRQDLSERRFDRCWLILQCG